MAVRGRTLLLILLHHTSPCVSVLEAGCYTDHVVPNVALGKTTYGSAHIYPPSGSVDGDRRDYIPFCYMSHLLNNPWLVVDLGEETPVSTVVMVARGDAAYHYTTDLRILVGNDAMESFDPLTWVSVQCGGSYETLERGEVMYVQCNQTLVGRYVCVHMQATHHLQVCELEVYSEQVFQHEAWTCVLPNLQRPNSSSNLALGRPAYLSTTPLSLESVALLVDGNDHPNKALGKSCAHSRVEVQPWFVVDLGTVTMVTGVKLINRQDCCSEWIRDISFYVGNNEGPSTPFDASKYEVCAKMCHQQTVRGRYYVCHTRPRGRHVALSHHVTTVRYIFMCEVEVYGHIAEDVSFPTRESGLVVTPSNQWRLYDDDDTTCVNMTQDLRGDGQQVSLTLHWDPAQMDSEHDAVSTYRCKEDFYVNVTHGADLRYTVVKAAGDLSRDNINGTLVSYKPCPMTGQTEAGGVLRTRFQCRCVEVCHLLLRVRYADLTPGGDNRLCTIKLYD